jgi:hypothetical protein
LDTTDPRSFHVGFLGFWTLPLESPMQQKSKSKCLTCPAFDNLCKRNHSLIEKFITTKFEIRKPFTLFFDGLMTNNNPSAHHNANAETSEASGLTSSNWWHLGSQSASSGTCEDLTLGHAEA